MIVDGGSVEVKREHDFVVWGIKLALINFTSVKCRAATLYSQVVATIDINQLDHVNQINTC